MSEEFYEIVKKHISSDSKKHLLNVFVGLCVNEKINPTISTFLDSLLYESSIRNNINHELGVFVNPGTIEDLRKEFLPILLKYLIEE